MLVVHIVALHLNVYMLYCRYYDKRQLRNGCRWRKGDEENVTSHVSLDQINNSPNVVV